MNYLDDNKEISVNQFFEDAAQLEKQLLDSGMDAAQVLEKKEMLLSLQFMKRKYIELQEQNPTDYPPFELSSVKEVYPYIEDIHEYMVNHGDGAIILNKMPITNTALLVKTNHAAMKSAGVSDNISERMIRSVVPALEQITRIAFNDRTGTAIKPSGLFDAADILKRKPQVIKMMTDEATQKVFKNDFERDNLSSYMVHIKKTENPAYMILSLSSTADINYRADIEKDFSYYDLAVMETIASLYAFAEEKKKLKNGDLVLDIKFIDKILKHGNTRMSKETQDKIFESEIYRSIRKLTGNHVSISEPSGSYEGDLVNGDIDVVGGKICLVVHEKPVLFQVVESNGTKYVQSIDMNDLDIAMQHTDENVAIYRFLLDRINMIFKTYLVDDKHKNAVSTNSIPLSSIIEAVYPEGLGVFKDETSKTRNIRENVYKVLDAMKQSKKFFTDYKIVSTRSGESIELSRD